MAGVEVRSDLVFEVAGTVVGPVANRERLQRMLAAYPAGELRLRRARGQGVVPIAEVDRRALLEGAGLRVTKPFSALTAEAAAAIRAAGTRCPDLRNSWRGDSRADSRVSAASAAQRTLRFIEKYGLSSSLVRVWNPVPLTKVPVDALAAAITPQFLENALSRLATPDWTDALLTDAAPLRLPVATRRLVLAAFGTSQAPKVSQLQGPPAAAVSQVVKLDPPETPSVGGSVSAILRDSPKMRWLVDLAFPGQASPVDALDNLTDLGNEIVIAVAEGDLEALHHTLDELSVRLEEVRSRIRPAAELTAMLSEANECFAVVSADHTGALAGVLRDCPSIPPRELRDLAGALKQLPLSAVPDWVIGESRSLPTLVKDGRLRDYLTAAALASEFAHLDARTLRSIPAPPAGVSLSDAIRFALETHSEVLGVAYRGWCHARMSGGNDLSILRECNRVLRHLSERLAPDAFKGLLAVVTSVGSAEEALTVVERWSLVAEDVERMFGSALEMSWKTLSHYAQSPSSSERTTSPQRQPAKDAGREYSIDHDWTGASGARAPVVFQHHADAPHGVVSLPLAIRSNHARRARFRLVVDVTTKQREAWPSDWPGVSPDIITVQQEDWRSEASGQGVAFALGVNVPIRRPKKDTEGLECVVHLEDADNDAVLTDSARLRWDQVTLNSGRISVEWPSGLNPGFVRDHPIGPQRHHEELESRVKSQTSFAVVAPRRFGKSTLAQYLVDFARSEGWTCPEPTACTGFVHEGRVDHSALWRHISDGLQRILGAAITRAGEDYLPADDSLDFVRRAAQTQGKKGLFIMLDEAQLFFPVRDGFSLGDRMKDRLERNWSLPRPVPVVIGLVGLPSLSERAGANLMGFLRPVEEFKMHEADVNSLLLRVTSERLHTTRSARIELARSAGNLFVLRTVLEQVVLTLNREQRRWANVEDIVHANHELMNSLEGGTASAVAGFVRDPLNTADSVNEWRPDVACPAAVALAMANRAGAATELARCAWVTDRLNRWCQEYSGSAVVTYKPHRTSEMFARLKANGIVQDGTFRSPYLEAWLRGQGRQGLSEPLVNALLRGSVKQIVLPSNARLVGEGGQASLWLVDEEGTSLAYRRIELKSDRDRERYVESIEILQRLKEEVSKNDDGAQYLFDVVDLGFSAQDESVGLQVYRWVQGSDLRNKVGALPATYVAHIGHCLAKAIRLLAAKGIVHRDIEPRNIILSDPEHTPILIDFGMARKATIDSRTVSPSEFSAPEVHGPDVNWSPAADIYALGATLRALLSKDEPCVALDDIIARCLSHSPDERPTPTELVKSLDDLLVVLRVAETRERAKRKVLEIIRPDDRKHWYRTVVDKHMHEFEAFELGLHGSARQKAPYLAAFVDQILESMPGLDSTTLGRLKSVGIPNGDKDIERAIEGLHKLRNDHHHAGRGRIVGASRGRDTLVGVELAKHFEIFGRVAKREWGLQSLGPLLIHLLRT